MTERVKAVLINRRYTLVFQSTNHIRWNPDAQRRPDTNAWAHQVVSI